MSAVTDILLAPDVRPFAVAAAIMVALGGIELLTTLVGFSIGELVGKDVAARDRQRWRPRRPVSVDQRRTPSAADPDRSRARRVRDRGILPAGPRARRRDCRSRSRSPRLPPQPSAFPRSASPAAASRASFRATRPMWSMRPTLSVTSPKSPIGPLDQGLPGRVRLKDVFGNWHSLVARASPEFHAAPGRRQRVAGRP